MLRYRLLNMLLNARKVNNREIPYGYTQVEYLESTGTQYIDTGYNSETSTKAHFVIEKTDVNVGDTTSGRGTAYFGVNAPSGEIILGYNNGVNYVRGNVGYTNYSLTIGEKNEVIVDYTKGATSLYINGKCYGTGTSTISNTYNTRMLMLFAIFGYSASTTKTYCQYKLYSFKMYNGYIKVRDYVPCLDDKGVPCLYDKVSGETFYNQGTGDFRVGYTLLAAYTPTVPTGYTLVDYLEGTGTQFLNTGFTVTTDNQATVRMEVDGNFGTSGTYSNWRVDGSGYPYLITTIGLNSNGQLSYGNKTADVSTGYLEPDPSGRHFYMTDYKRGVYQRDWETIKTWTPQTGGNSNNLFIFAYKQTDSSKQVNAQKHSFKIFEDDFIKFYGVPCLDAEGTPCMYDLVGEKAIYNVGTGTFKYGDVIGGVNIE